MRTRREIPARLEKPIQWRGSSYVDLLAFPEDARRIAGFQLGRLQQGDEPDDWKPMAVVGAGTIEVRIRVGTAHRVFAVTKFAEAIYVLHAFEKKSQKTPKNDIDLAKRRYRELVAERSRL
jgi:phage-related protein